MLSQGRRRGIHRVQLESQPMLTQRRPEVDDKQDTEKHKDANPNATDARTEKCQSVSARRLKVAWRSRVTGAHPLSTFMKLETYRMFEYDANLRRYRCFYAHDPEVDLTQFMQCFNACCARGKAASLGFGLFSFPHAIQGRADLGNQNRDEYMGRRG